MALLDYEHCLALLCCAMLCTTWLCYAMLCCAMLAWPVCCAALGIVLQVKACFLYLSFYVINESFGA